MIDNMVDTDLDLTMDEPDVSDVAAHHPVNF